jgi:hypothetical protein
VLVGKGSLALRVFLVAGAALAAAATASTASAAVESPSGIQGVPDHGASEGVAPFRRLVPENPVHNLKILYGSGFERVRQNGQVERVGGVLAIKDRVVYDAPRLLANVAAMVEAQKQ